MTFLSKIHWWRVFIIIVIPFILSFWLFAYPISFDFDRINQTQNIGNTSKTIQILKYPYPKTYSPTEKIKQFTSNFLSNVLHIPLQLNSIYYCFKDKGSFIEYRTIEGNENDYKNFNWTLNFNNEKNFTILRNRIKCELVDKSKEFTYNWQMESTITIKGGYTQGLTFHPNTTSFARKNIIEIITKSFTLLLAWMTICWMLHGVYNIIKRKNIK